MNIDKEILLRAMEAQKTYMIGIPAAYAENERWICKIESGEFDAPETKESTTGVIHGIIHNDDGNEPKEKEPTTFNCPPVCNICGTCHKVENNCPDWYRLNVLELDVIE